MNDHHLIEAPALDRRFVHVWKVPLTGDVDLAMKVLNPAERSRADRRQDESVRRRFILSRSALRRILAGYLEAEPGDLIFTANEHGKPELADQGLKFNLSHAGYWSLLAVARGAEVGVDIECITDRHHLEAIAHRFFSVPEQEALMEFPLAERIPAFFRAWSRKEAVIKALGEGLACPLSSFDVTLGKGRAELLAFRRENMDVTRWSLCDLDVPPGYAGAVAVMAPLFQVRTMDPVNLF